MGLICTKANSEGLHHVFWMSVYFSNVNFKHFLNIFTVLYLVSKIFNLLSYTFNTHKSIRHKNVGKTDCGLAMGILQVLQV